MFSGLQSYVWTLDWGLLLNLLHSNVAIPFSNCTSDCGLLNPLHSNVAILSANFGLRAFYIFCIKM